MCIIGMIVMSLGLQKQLEWLPSQDMCRDMLHISFQHEQYLRCRRAYDVVNWDEWTALINETTRRREPWRRLRDAHSYIRFAHPWVVAQEVLGVYELVPNGVFPIPWSFDGGYVE